MEITASRVHSFGLSFIFIKISLLLNMYFEIRKCPSSPRERCFSCFVLSTEGPTGGGLHPRAGRGRGEAARSRGASPLGASCRGPSERLLRARHGQHSPWAGAVRGECAHQMPGAGSRGRAQWAGLRGVLEEQWTEHNRLWKQRGRDGTSMDFPMGFLLP